MQRHVTDCEGLRIVVSLTDEVSEAITSWASVAEMYERKTEVTLEILGQHFISKNQFKVFHSEIKYYISKGLSETDRNTIEESKLFLNVTPKTPKMKQLTDARNLIVRKINKIYNRLLQELFPSFVPTEEGLPRVVTPPRPKLVIVRDDETIPYDEPKEDDATTVDEDFNYDGELPTDISLLSLEEPVEEIAPQFRRSRYGNATKSLPQDLFETPENALMLLDPILDTLKGKVIYEPCCGNGAIVRYLEKKGFTVISRDLYTTELKQDYLVEEDPEYDVLITNPPFCVKHQFFEKAMLSSKPFIMLLPLSFLIAKCSYENIKKCLIDIIIMNPSPSFLNGDVERHVGECGWFIVNLTEGGRFTVERLPDI